jgi:transcriptional regulator
MRAMGEEFDRMLERAASAARKGARSATRSASLIEIAVERTVDKFEDAQVRRKSIKQVEAWCFRVGRNEARIAGRKATRTRSGYDGLEGVADLADGISLPPANRQLLMKWLRGRRRRITKEQLQVLSLLVQGVSFHQVAERLGKDRANLRRAVRRALRRLMSV